MTNGYLTFLDYFELRRRVDRRLASGKLLILHTILFIVGATALGTAGFPSVYPADDYYYVEPTMGHIVGLWSAVLLYHALWTYWHSGARTGQREEAVEHQMREQLRSDDIYISHDPKVLFRLHGLLHDDFLKRTTIIPVLALIIFLNAVIWIPWALVDVHSSFAWKNAPILIIPFVIVVLWNIWAQRGHAARLKGQLEQYFSNENEYDDQDDAREMRLSDDDKLTTLDEYMMKRKRL